VSGVAGHRAIAGGLVLGAAVTWDISNVGAVAGVMATAYGVSLAAVGLLTTALFLTHLAVQIPGGRLIDRVGARSVGVAALVIVASANVLALTTPSLAVGLSARMLMGSAPGPASSRGSISCAPAAAGRSGRAPTGAPRWPPAGWR
jgi:MFS family permease